MFIIFFHKLPGNFLFRLKLEVARHATDPTSAQDAHRTRYPRHHLRRTGDADPRPYRRLADAALGFETGFVIIGVTMVAIVLGVSLLQAFMLEIGFMLFFLPYTMAFNWVWDTLRERVIRHRRPRQTARG